MDCRKSLLFSSNETWKKKSTQSCFDVTMGSFDGAGISELVAFYTQSNLENIPPKIKFGLQQDDGLIGCPKEGNCQVNIAVYKCDVTKPLPKQCL